jgi:serine/threonine-protein kinase
MSFVTTHAQRAREVLEPRYPGLVLLREGRTGLVFSAHRGEADGPIVAIKVAYPANGQAEHSSTLARFRREAEIGARLSHPHILRCTPVETAQGLEFYEMDKAGPVRLDQLVIAAKPPRFERILLLLRQLADALDYAHAHGVVHGALRPSAVLLDASGEVLLKGFCLYADREAAHPSLTPAAVGDPAYMAPEQWHDRTVGRRVDIYAMGVLAYELCTSHARVGYDAQGVPEIRPIEFAPNHPLRPDVPPHASAAIRRALNKDPDVRYATAGQFVQALTREEVALGHSLPTHKPPLTKRPHSAWILVLLVLLIAVVLAFAVPSPLQELLLPLVTRPPSP